MKRLSYSFQTRVEFDAPVEDHEFVLRCLPTSDATQSVIGQLELDPSTDVTLQRDGFGNAIAVGYLEAPHDHFYYRSFGTATVDQERAMPCEAHPMYRFASPRAKTSPAMKDFLAQHPAAEGATELQRCQELSHLVHEELEYQPGSTSVATTAAEAFEQKKGVCQDYAHILIALLRAEGIPARYASGLTLGQGMTHAWVQAHIDGCWHSFDPTRDKLVDDGYLVIAVGRDWSDCPIERGTFQGLSNQTQTIYMQVKEE